MPRKVYLGRAFRYLIAHRCHSYSTRHSGQQKNWVPVGAEFGENTYEKNFGMGIKHHMLLFISSKADNHKDTTAYFKKLGKEFKGQVRIF